MAILLQYRYKYSVTSEIEEVQGWSIYQTDHFMPCYNGNDSPIGISLQMPIKETKQDVFVTQRFAFAGVTLLNI